MIKPIFKGISLAWSKATARNIASAGITTALVAPEETAEFVTSRITKWFGGAVKELSKETLKSPFMAAAIGTGFAVAGYRYFFSNKDKSRPHDPSGMS